MEDTSASDSTAGCKGGGCREREREREREGDRLIQLLKDQGRMYARI